MFDWRKIFYKIIQYPTYKLASLDKDENGNYSVTIQISRRGICFKTTPERILSQDSVTDKFSPRDIRTLTYLGYLEINSPKYKILAQRLADNDERLLVLFENKNNTVETKTANEISKDKKVLSQMNPQDAHLIGYMKAYEEVTRENKLKKETDSTLDNITNLRLNESNI